MLHLCFDSIIITIITGNLSIICRCFTASSPKTPNLESHFFIVGVVLPLATGCGSLKALAFRHSHSAAKSITSFTNRVYIRRRSVVFSSVCEETIGDVETRLLELSARTALLPVTNSQK